MVSYCNMRWQHGSSGRHEVKLVARGNGHVTARSTKLEYLNLGGGNVMITFLKTINSRHEHLCNLNSIIIILLNIFSVLQFAAASGFQLPAYKW